MANPNDNRTHITIQGPLDADVVVKPTSEGHVAISCDIGLGDDKVHGIGLCFVITRDGAEKLQQALAAALEP
jgi:hypothetical protein